MKLIECQSHADMQSLGKKMQNALSHKGFLEILEHEKLRVFSNGEEDPARLIAVSVRHDNTCRHVVGERNRRPTPEELEAVKTGLAELGFTLDYSPTSPY